MNVPFHKPYITDDEVNAVKETVKSGWLTMGPKTIEFEDNFKEYVGIQNAVSVNSCTSALHLALEAIDLKESDEVLVPAMTFTATAEVICYFNATPVFVDIEKDTHNISVAEIEKHITPKTKAIIPVHYGGQPCDMDEICELAKKYGLYVIEDAAHALPSRYKNRLIGTIGDITCFSFYATKTLSCGEGGMITTNNHEWAEKIKTMRLHGISKDAWKRYSKEGTWYYEVVDVGYKYNMTDIQSALGIAQLKKLELMCDKRKNIAGKYNEAFQGINEIITPHINAYTETSWHLYPIKLNFEKLKIDRNMFIELLNQRGIGTSVHFIPLYRHPFYKNRFSLKKEQFPHCEWVYNRIISLPIYPGMNNENIDQVIGEIIEIVKKNRK